MLTDHQVLGFDVPVHYILGVHMVERPYQLIDVLVRHHLVKHLILLLYDFVEELTASDVLHDQINR